MRVALVSEHASPLAALGGVDAGGQNVHVAELADALSLAGHHVVVYTRRDAAGQPPRVLLASGVEVVHVDAGPARSIPKDDLLPAMGPFGEQLLTAWRREPPDVVHAHFWMSGLAAMHAARSLGIPVVQTFHALGVVKRRHQGAADTSPPVRAVLEPRLAHSVDHVIATCSDELLELRQLGVPRRRITTIPCGVDLGRFTPRGPVEPRGRRRLRVVAVSRLVPRKGIADLITALPTAPPIELIVAGGPDRADLDHDQEARRLRLLARGLGVEQQVDLRGRVARDDLPALLRSADLVANVPWYEPFGIVPVEAMACGVPVLASAVGGMIDTVVPGQTGWHVPPRSPAVVSSALERIESSPAQRSRFGAAGARRAARQYGWIRIAQATIATYRHVVDADRRRRATFGPPGHAPGTRRAAIG